MGIAFCLAWAVSWWAAVFNEWTVEWQFNRLKEGPWEGAFIHVALGFMVYVLLYKIGHGR